MSDIPMEESIGLDEEISRCESCLQVLDDITSIDTNESHPEEKDAIVKVIDGDIEEKQQMLLENFTFYDEHGHMLPLNDHLVEKNAVHFNGILRPLWFTGSDDENEDGEDPQPATVSVKAGPIKQWWTTGMGEGDTPAIGVTTELADYYLQAPAEKYKSIHEDLTFKTRIMNIVLRTLMDHQKDEDLPSYHYNNMLEDLQTIAPEITEENLLQHGQYIIKQINSYNSVSEEGHDSLSSAPFIKELCELVGVEFVEIKKKVEKTVASDKIKATPAPDLKSNVATTTPLVRHVFASMLAQKGLLKNSTKSEKDFWSKRCGVCTPCQEKDCGNCPPCKNMIKFGGDGDKDISPICNQKRCEKYKKMKEAEESLPEAFEKQSQINRQKHAKARWISDPVEHNNSKFYSRAEVNGEELEIGHFVLVRPDDDNTAHFIFRILYFEQDGADKIAHVQSFCRGSDTLLGETADSKELFAILECESIPMYDIVRKIRASYWPGPSQWRSIGGSQESTFTPSEEIEDPLTFWYRMTYNPSLGRFEVVPPQLLNMKKDDIGQCSLCKYLEAKQKYLEPHVVKLNDGSGKKVLMFRNEKFQIGDAVFLTSSGVMEGKASIAPKPKSKVDPEVYTEYYRKFIKNNETCKGSLADFPKPFEIGIILEITDRNNNPTIRVRKMLRPEDTNMKSPNECDLNLVFYTEKESIVSAERIEGKCYVVPRHNIAEEPFLWTEKGEHRFYYEQMYNIKTRSFSELPKNAFDIHADSFEDPDFMPDLPVLSDDEKLKCMDVYGGCGGLSMGLEASGLVETKWGIEFFAPAGEAFKLNHPDASVIVDDCNRVLKKAMAGDTTIKAQNGKQSLPVKGEVDLLCGGPPCQGFSIMNNFSDRDYSRMKNSQISTYLSICDYYRPRFFILENVRNLANFNGSMVFKLLMRTLVMMGYQCTFGVLQGGAYGIPQTRHRIFIIAAAPDEKLPIYPEPTHVFRNANASVRVDGKMFKSNIRWTSAPYRTTTTRDAMFDLRKDRNDNDDRQLETQKYPKPPMSHAQKLMRWNPKTKKFLPTLIDHVTRQLDPLNAARLAHIPKHAGADWRDLPNISIELSNGEYSRKLKYLYKDISNNTGGRKRGVCMCQTGKKQKCSDMDSFGQDRTLIPWFLPHTAQRNNQWAGLYGRIDWDGYFSTTITAPTPGSKQGRVIHPDQDRLVSIRECARSQGFVDTTKFYGTITEKYRQIGNAVPPPLARAVGKQIFKAYMWKKNRIVGN